MYWYGMIWRMRKGWFIDIDIDIDSDIEIGVAVAVAVVGCMNMKVKLQQQYRVHTVYRLCIWEEREPKKELKFGN